MKSFAICLPILPGKTQTWMAFVSELGHARKVEFDATMKRCGVSRSRLWLQKTNAGDMAFVLHEGSSPEMMLAEVGKSHDPFSQWFVSNLKECHGSIHNATEQKLDCLHTH